MRYIYIYFGINIICTLYIVCKILRDRDILKKNPELYVKGKKWMENICESYTSKLFIMMLFGSIVLVFYILYFYICILGVTLEFTTDKILSPVAGFLNNIIYKIKYPKFLEKLRIYKFLLILIERVLKFK